MSSSKTTVKKPAAPRVLKQKIHEITLDIAGGPMYFYAYGLTKQGALNEFTGKLVSVDVPDNTRMIAHIRKEGVILGEPEVADPNQETLPV